MFAEVGRVPADGPVGLESESALGSNFDGIRSYGVVAVNVEYANFEIISSFGGRNEGDVSYDLGVVGPIDFSTELSEIDAFGGLDAEFHADVFNFACGDIADLKSTVVDFAYAATQICVFVLNENDVVAEFLSGSLNNLDGDFFSGYVTCSGLSGCGKGNGFAGYFEFADFGIGAIEHFFALDIDGFFSGGQSVTKW